ncbi:unnamed protein product [Peniophora sp. CBMAI 1063]|nr:unnamed protein product [Peniophora sp. CBMAI 1063]
MSYNLTPIIISDSESDGDEVGELPDSSDNGTPSGCESDEDSLTFPPVGPPLGNEDDESDAEMGDIVLNVPAPSADLDGGPGLPSNDQVSDGNNQVSDEDVLRVPEIERHGYTMDHTDFSPPLTVSVPVPEPFSRAGLQNSEHFNEWLDHLRRQDVPEPPYADHLSDLDAAVYLALSVNVRREAENLFLLRELLALNESEIMELSRIDFVVARAMTNPVMESMARAQGVELTFPEWRRRQATIRPPAVSVRPGGYNIARPPLSESDTWGPATSAGSSSSTGLAVPRSRRGVFVDPSGGPVRFGSPPAVKDEYSENSDPDHNGRPRPSTSRRRVRSESIQELPPKKKPRD